MNKITQNEKQAEGENDAVKRLSKQSIRYCQLSAVRCSVRIQLLLSPLHLAIAPPTSQILRSFLLRPYLHP